jgi:uncharacterized Zn-binding protein involved in type VI secretion
VENEEPKDKTGAGQEWKPSDSLGQRGSTYTPDEGWKKDDPAEPEKGPERKVTIYQHTWVDKKGYVGPSDKGETAGKYGSGKASVGSFYGKAEASSKLSYNVSKGEVNLTPVNVKGQFSIDHADAEGKFKLGSWISSFFSSAEELGAGTGTLMAARVGDLTSHGSGLLPGIGSTNVFIGYKPAWRTVMDFHACPVVKGTVPDVGGVVAMGSPTVFINYAMACRVGDIVVEAPGGPNAIAVGCPTVFIGPAGPSSAAPPEKEGLTIQAKGSGDLLTAGAEANAGFVANKEKVVAQVKASAIAAVAKGSIEGGITIPLWGTHSITLGVGAEGSYLSIGAEAHADAGWTKEQGVHASWGAGAAYGAGGAMDFSIGVK